MNKQTQQLVSSLFFAIPTSIVLANAALSQTIAPTTQPDCTNNLCTRDGAILVKPKKPTKKPVQRDVLMPCKLDGKIIKGCWIR